MGVSIHPASFGSAVTMRPSWDEYFLSLAQTVSTRATCKRRKVGSVVVRDKRVLTTGYNGSPPGLPHCLDVGCDMVDGHCVRTVHAEANAIVQAALHGISTRGATLYTTCSCCLNCSKLVIAAGIVKVVYAEAYDESEETERTCAYLTEGLRQNIMERPTPPNAYGLHLLSPA